MKLTISILLFSMALIGCVSGGIDDVNTSGKNQSCVRQCTNTYSNCIGASLSIAAQRACASGFRVCANTCPDK